MAIAGEKIIATTGDDTFGIICEAERLLRRYAPRNDNWFRMIYLGQVILLFVQLLPEYFLPARF